MLKKIMLAVATFGIVAIAYQIYDLQDDAPHRTQQSRPVDLPPRASAQRSPTTQPALTDDLAKQAFTIRDAVIPSGEAPAFRMYDRKGQAKIVFRATEWQPVRDDEFHMVEPAAQLLLPGGQLAHVRADEGQVIVQKGDGGSLNPKRGWFRGHVSIFVDLTKPQWRKANPDLVEPEKHPESVVKIWLDDVRFDLDLTRLESDGPILLQSTRGELEGRGLTLVWNEVDRRIKQLTIAQGKRATLRNIDLAGFGASEDAQADQVAALSSPPPAAPPSATAVTPARKKRTTPSESPDDHELSFLDLDEEETVKPREDRIDSYRITFSGDVLAEQKEGLKVAGRLATDVLELLCHFGRNEREALEQSPTTKPAGVDGPAVELAGARPEVGLELRWSGPLNVIPVEEALAAARKPAQAADLSKTTLAEQPSAAPAQQMEMMVAERMVARGHVDLTQYSNEGAEQVVCGRLEVEMTVDDTGRNVPKAVRAFDRVLARALESKAALDQPGDEPSASEVRAEQELSIELASVPRPVSQTERTRLEAAARERGIEPGSPEWRRVEEGLRRRRQIVTTRMAARGEATFARSGESITADQVEVTFRQAELAPGASGRSAMDAADRVIADGNVHMTRQGKRLVEEVLCDRLEVVMTLDDTGQNVPATGRAIGHVVARQVERSGGLKLARHDPLLREIRAADEIVTEMTSMPVPVTDAERARLEARARERFIEPGSPEWVRNETKLRNRRELVTTRMVARGKVTVRDREQELHLAADTLDCAFTRNQQIERALIVGHEEELACVDTGDFFIRGAQISLNMTTQSAEVPGPGMLRFLSKQDLDGRSVEEPVPVVVNWSERMWLNGEKNTGRFVGEACAVSESVRLNSHELQTEFVNLPKPPAGPAPASPGQPDTRWIAGPIIDALTPANSAAPKAASATNRATRAMRKRLAYLHAVGDAVIQAKVYAERPAPQGGALSRWLASALPAALQPTVPTPANPPLSSRLRVAGPRIAIDLLNEHLAVEGVGNLLIEDYRLPTDRDRQRQAASARSGGTVTGASVASLESVGPSQTAFQWKNSMLFLNNRSVAVFEDDVNMTHRAGAKMVELERLATAMNVDVRQLQQLPGREAGLTCENLLVEFERGGQGNESDPSPLSRATRLKHFRASGRVLLQENNRGVIGTQVAYTSDSGTGRVIGSPALPAQFFMRDERSGRVQRVSVETFDWDQRTGLIRMKQATAVATSK